MDAFTEYQNADKLNSEPDKKEVPEPPKIPEVNLQGPETVYKNNVHTRDFNLSWVLYALAVIILLLFAWWGYRWVDNYKFNTRVIKEKSEPIVKWKTKWKTKTEKKYIVDDWQIKTLTAENRRLRENLATWKAKNAALQAHITIIEKALKNPRVEKITFRTSYREGVLEHRREQRGYPRPSYKSKDHKTPPHPTYRRVQKRPYLVLDRQY